MKKGYTLIELLVVIVILSTIVVMIVSGGLICKGIEEVSEKGLKNTLEEIWEGPKQPKEPVIIEQKTDGAAPAAENGEPPTK